MEGSRAGGRNPSPNQLRPFSCTRNPLDRAVLGSRRHCRVCRRVRAHAGNQEGGEPREGLHRGRLEGHDRPGQFGKQEKEYEMTLKRTLQSI